MILVLGGGGQLALEIERSAIAGGATVASFTKTSVDIRNRNLIEDVIKRAKASFVVNAAAYTAVDRAESEAKLAYAVNAEGAGNVAAACAELDVPLVHISTDYVFDGTKASGYVEDDPVNPTSVYGASKLAGELLVSEKAFRYIILRTSWVYGEFGHNFLKTILRLASERDELKVVADQRGCPTCTRDLAGGILHLIDCLQSSRTGWGTYHFAGAGSTTWFDFARHIVSTQAAITGREPRVTAITTAEFPTAAKRPLNSVLDCQKFQRQFNYQPRKWQFDATEVVISLLQPGAGASND